MSSAEHESVAVEPNCKEEFISVRVNRITVERGMRTTLDSWDYIA